MSINNCKKIFFNYFFYKLKKKYVLKIVFFLVTYYIRVLMYTGYKQA